MATFDCKNNAILYPLKYHPQNNITQHFGEEEIKAQMPVSRAASERYILSMYLYLSRCTSGEFMYMVVTRGPVCDQVPFLRISFFFHSLIGSPLS